MLLFLADFNELDTSHRILFELVEIHKPAVFLHLMSVFLTAFKIGNRFLNFLFIGLFLFNAGLEWTLILKPVILKCLDIAIVILLGCFIDQEPNALVIFHVCINDRSVFDEFLI